MTEQERAEIAREKGKADTAIIVLTIGMVVWAGSVFLDGGYTDEPQHHEMWRSVAAISGIWGFVLLLIFRYSWANLLCALTLMATGFYLANAPTITTYQSNKPSRAAVYVSDTDNQREVYNGRE